MMCPKPTTKKGRHKQTIACDISPQVKAKVWERDGQCCIICGSPHAMPNSHYIRRSKMGKGIEQNVVTMCADCHFKTDNGVQQEEYMAMVKTYLESKYERWNENELMFSKWE